MGLCFIPLLDGKLWKKRIRTKTETNQKIRVKTILWILFYNSRPATKKTIAVSSNYKNVVSTECELQDFMRVNVRVFQATFSYYFIPPDCTYAQGGKSTSAVICRGRKAIARGFK